MQRKELLVKKINELFARWQIEIENLNSMNLHDLNLFSEYMICDLLNIIFDYKLKNINASEKNYPSIDLSDRTNRIAVQVTATSSKVKIQSTLTKFFGNNLQEHYDELYIIILGKRQVRYSGLKIEGELFFDEKNHILDFRDLLRKVIPLNLDKVEEITRILNIDDDKPKVVKKSNASRITRNLSLKKKLKKDLLREINQSEWEYSWCEPWIKFKYHNLIIRSVDDTSWPVVDEAEEGRMSSWIKAECWDFYENGLELIGMGGRAVIDEEGYWDIVDGRDLTGLDKKYELVQYTIFYRIPYDYIIKHDMEVDRYYSLPTIYVEYAKDGMPYDEILYGRMGYYDKKDRSKSRHTSYFDNRKRVDLF